ncbi:helix-turn-helix domain-containing protein [Trichlorobacter sp.]|uniref:helix-turn-helix domain-containing protein n=1 Tax=Trichlorobacter sp. TaxID=2911007 RepID=UPI0039C96E4C
MDFGKRLEAFRKASGLTQQQLGEKVGVSKLVIAYYEGETSYPPAHLVSPLATALNVSTGYLAQRVGDRCDLIAGVVGVRSCLAQWISYGQGIAVCIMGQLIDCCNGWSAGCWQGDTEQVVGGGMISQAGNLATGIGDGQQVAFAVVGVVGGFICRVGGGLSSNFTQ